MANNPLHEDIDVRIPEGPDLQPDAGGSTISLSQERRAGVEGKYTFCELRGAHAYPRLPWPIQNKGGGGGGLGRVPG